MQASTGNMPCIVMRGVSGLGIGPQDLSPENNSTLRKNANPGANYKQNPFGEYIRTSFS